MEKEELEKENEEYINTINELKTQIENVKPVSGGHDEFEHWEFSQTKTKGTFSDKDDSQHRFHLGIVTLLLFFNYWFKIKLKIF